MTMTTLVVLMAALAEHGSGTGGPPATAAQRGAARDAPRSPAAVTCTMRVVRRSPTFDAGILAPRPRVYGDALAGLDAIVRDAASACAGSSTRRVSEPRAGER